MSGLTYDTGALLAAERNDRSLWALHARALARAVRPTVPAPVLAQAWRGGPQPLLSRFLHGCRIEPLTDGLARAAGSALAASRGHDIVDATVVASALSRDDPVVSSDPRDLRRLASALGRALVVHRV
jgi:predicted nucleic acid-binding protein